MHILIIGGGKVGTSLADMLTDQGHQVTIIEMRDLVFAKNQRLFKHVQHVLGDGCNPQTLRDAEIGQMEAVVAVTGDDEDNLVVAKLAKHEFRVGKVIARVNNPKNEWLFGPKMGVDIAVSHSTMLARLIHEELGMRDLVPLLKLEGSQVAVVEFTVPATAAIVGSRVEALQLPSASVLATLVRNGDLVIPRGDTVIEAGDRIIALAKTEQQSDLMKIFG